MFRIVEPELRAQPTRGFPNDFRHVLPNRHFTHTSVHFVWRIDERIADTTARRSDNCGRYVHLLAQRPRGDETRHARYTYARHDLPRSEKQRFLEFRQSELGCRGMYGS